MQIKCKIIDHGSADYWQAVRLRSLVLREPLGLAYSADELQAEKDSIHLVALSGKKTVGSLTMKPVKTALNNEENIKTIKMRQVAVESRLQGKNVGKTMVWFAEQWAAANGYEQIILHVRETATGFYQKTGYQLDTVLFEEIGLPHYKAAKRL